MKPYITIILLVLIALFMQLYLLNGNEHSEKSIYLLMPITINILFVLICFFSPENSSYRKVIKICLIFCIVISIFYFGFYWRIVQIGKAFKN